MTTELITAITTLDRSKEAADQGTLDEIKKQSDLYKKTMYTFAEMLKSLNEQKTSLLGILVIPFNDAPTNLNSMITQKPDHIPAAPSESTDTLSLINEIEELDGTKQQLTQELIEKCSLQRDKYREGVYNLKDAIISCQEKISNLEHHLAAQAHLPSTPKKADIDSPSSSPEKAVSPNTLEQRQQIQLLREQVAQVKEGQISAKDRDGALENYIFLLFVQEKIKRNEPVILEKFNPFDLSAKDKILLKEVTTRALQSMDPKSVAYDLPGLFRSKNRNVDRKIKEIEKLKKTFGQTDTGITRLEGKAREIFSHFFSLLKLSKKDSSVKKNYGDFIFSRDPFLAADLLLAEKIYEECKAYYEKNRGPKDPQLVMINEKISQIKEVQRLFLVLLENCQFFLKTPKSDN